MRLSTKANSIPKIDRFTLRGIVAVLMLLSTTLLAALPEWANTFGTNSPYESELYYTGFGLSQRSDGDAEALDAAKARAKADLISKIEVQVSSSVVSRESSEGNRSVTEATATSESLSSLDIENVLYDVDKNRSTMYVLARIEKTALASAYMSELEELLSKIIATRDSAQVYERAGENAAAIKTYTELTPLLQEAFRVASLLGTVARSTTDLSSSRMSEGGTVRGTVRGTELSEIGAEVDDALERLRYGDTGDIDSAMDLMVLQLKEQRVAAGSFQVANLTYQDSDYSSAFGAYAADAIEAALARDLSGRGSQRIVRGSYWVKDDSVELRLIVQMPDGRINGSSTLGFPSSSLPGNLELTPRNFEQALVDQREITSGAIVDGGISVEIWTNQGRNSDRLVFVEGEIIQFYFRVNQPSYLQLTYILASGEKVLLDESFYIGQDKVNLVVQYPTEFEPVAPFGVERLVTTAYEDRPPKPNIVVREIDGYPYQVFASTDDMYSATRGIRPRAQTEPDRKIRVGEAILTLTTAASISND